MISREEVIWLYRCLLGRDPESESVIHKQIELSDSFSSARREIMASREFCNNNMASVFYRGDTNCIQATKSPRNKLALATIVKDEEKNIEFMIRSCLPVIDFVALVDTGSQDTTISIARSILVDSGIRHAIAEIDFKDFSQARNAALDLVPSDLNWTIMIDADEHLVPEDYWRLNALLDADVDAWQLPRYNFYDAQKKEAPKPYPDYQRRLFRNNVSSPIRFRGAVHEEPINVKTWGLAPVSDGGVGRFVGGPHIHHMGQVDLSQERWRQKHEFYTRLSVTKPESERILPDLVK